MACSDGGQKDENVQYINLDKAEKIDIEDYIEDVSCIVLPDNTLTDCWRIIEYGDMIYLYSLSNFAVSIHTSSGDFVRTIDSSGKGSVTFPSSIYIDKYKNELWIIDEREYMNTYTLAGDFIERKKLLFTAADVCSINNSYLFFDGVFGENSTHCFHFASFDNGDFNLTGSCMEKKGKERYTISPSTLFAPNNASDTVFILPNRSSTIYFSDNINTFTPLFKLKSDKYKILDEEDYPAEGFSDKEMADILNDETVLSNISSFYYSNGKLFFRTNNADNPYYMLRVGDSELYCFTELMEGLTTSTPATSIQGSSGGYLYFFFSVKEIKEHYEKKSLSSNYQAINQVLNDSNNKGNVIVKVKIKD